MKLYTTCILSLSRGYGAEMLTAMSCISYSLENTNFNLDEENKSG